MQLWQPKAYYFSYYYYFRGLSCASTFKRP
jgi:hypothetical protein